LKNDSIGQKEARKKDLKQTIKLLLLADRLLDSHPSYRLQTWVDDAHHQATTPEEYAHYESNAKRLITTWGGFQSDYAGRVWSGLIRDYYVPRIIKHLSDKKIDISVWEENWIRKPWRSKMKPYSDPVNTAKRLVFETKNKSL